jgi:multisubunit Na+/H+ antiporter MnhF subunit
MCETRAPVSTGEEGGVVWEEAERVLRDWYRRARESQFAHYAAASRYAMLARLLGIPSVVLSAAAGTALFASLQKETASFDLRLVLGLVSVLAGVLAALQTFLGFGERADRHRTAASAYGAVRRDIEQHRALPPQTAESVEALLSRLRGRLDAIAEKAPDVPERTWNTARKTAAISPASPLTLRDTPGKAAPEP